MFEQTKMDVTKLKAYASILRTTYGRVLKQWCDPKTGYIKIVQQPEIRPFQDKSPYQPSSMVRSLVEVDQIYPGISNFWYWHSRVITDLQL